MSKAFKKLGKSKLARGLLAAAAVYFLGSWLSGGDSAAAVAEGASNSDLITEPPGSEKLIEQSADSQLIAEPPETPIPPPAPIAATPTPTAAPAPATAASVTQPPGTQASPAAQANTGIIGKWFKDLSPAGQAVVASSVAGGASALMGALAQKNAMEDQKEREEKAREDKMRRTAIPALPQGAFRPRGIVGSRMG